MWIAKKHLMSGTVERILGAAFAIVAIGATVDGWDIAKHNPSHAENKVDRCFRIPRNITSVPNQLVVCAPVPRIWGEQVLQWGRSP